MAFGDFQHFFVSLEGSIELLHLFFGYDRVVLAADKHHRLCGAYLLEEMEVVFVEEGKF